MASYEVIENNVKLLGKDGSECLVNLFGATLTSWKNRGEEILFCSEKAVFDGKKAIRGGIPVIFPNFGAWELGPQHGFARIKQWQLKVLENSDGSQVPTFILEDDEETRNMWNKRFKLEYVVEIGTDTLTTTLTVHNTDSKSFSFTTLLHTYFRVQDVTKTQIKGLKGLTYTDKVHGGDHTEDRDLVCIDENVDRIYQNCEGPVHLIPDMDKVTECREVTANNLPDIVVWNPWEEKAKAMADFGDTEYINMVCVEAGAVSKPVTIQAKQTMAFSQTLSVKKGSKI